MPLASRLTQMITWKPLPVGEPAPALSLTADEGTWVKLPDFVGHLNVVLVFFQMRADEELEGWLSEFHRRRPQFEDLDTAIFAISTARPDRLRELRTRLGLEYYLLYDPFGLDARGFRCSSRVRPMCKDNVVVVDKTGAVAFSQRGRVDPHEVLGVVSQIEGKAASELSEEQDNANGSGDASTDVRNPGAPPAVVKRIDSTKAESLLHEDDSPYILIDVRTKSEYEADHSALARHIPIDELPHRYRELEQTTHIICVCQAGGRSAAAAEFLTSIGCSDIYDVEGGMSAWSGDRVTGGQQQA